MGQLDLEAERSIHMKLKAKDLQSVERKLQQYEKSRWRIDEEETK